MDSFQNDEQEHVKRHKFLHKELDELVADFIIHTEKSLKTSIIDLMEWFFRQTKNPDTINKE